MRGLKLILSILFLSFGVINSMAAPSVGEADSAYNAGNYLKAIDLYQEVMSEYGTSAAVLYNLGNAYMQQDDYGNAMASYLRAKKLDPSNKMINNNLEYLKGKVEDANKAEQKGKRKNVAEDAPNFFQSVHSSIAENTSSNLWAGWAAAMFLIFSGCAALYLFSGNVMARKTGFFGGFIFLGISIICLVCAYSAAAASENHEYGVVVAFKAALQTEPQTPISTDKNEGVLTRGTKIRIISEETDAEGNVSWYKVRLNSEYIGWIESKDITII